MFNLGFLINPIAGVGGSAALKGSDGTHTVKQALSLGASLQANNRAKIALALLTPYKDDITIFTASGEMGERCARELGFNVQVVYQTATANNQATPLTTTAQDTIETVQALLALDNNIDLLVFAGGDGTARNICQQVAESFPVLGIPAGCKIHSGVYAITPKAAGRVIELMITHQLVSLQSADVMDIDETLFREGIVKAKRYGEMTIPSELQYIQAVKSGGKESDELVLQDIAADVISRMDDELFIIGSGSTTQSILEELSIASTLLGVDVVQEQNLVQSDITEQALWQLLQSINPEDRADKVKLVITVIGGQGHLFGRGNQQLSPRIIRFIGKENIIVVATKRKLQALNGRPLIIDSSDPALDQELSGYISITTGYRDQVLYPVASPE